MKYKITGKNIEVTDAMKERVEKKLGVLDKYILIDKDAEARVLARVYKNNKKEQKIEITIPSKVGVLRSEVTSSDFYEALDLAIDKLEDQIRKQKTRLYKHHKNHLSKEFIEEAFTQEIKEEIPIKTKSVSAESLSIDEAVLQMELSGHNFYVFTDEDTNKHEIVYNRREGGYGLIEID